MALSRNFITIDSIKIGEEKSRDILIKNIGGANLIIDTFRCSCECTLPELRKNQLIIPIDSFRLKFTIKAYQEDAGKWKNVLCTFKSNTDSVFSYVRIKYFTK